VWRVGWLVSDFILKKEIILNIIKDIKRGGHSIRIIGRFIRNNGRFINIKWTAHQLVRF